MCFRLLVLMMLFSLNAFSQYEGPSPKVAPVSPEAAALFKLSSRPQSGFTGTVPISFPLFSVSSGQLNVPVSLNYAMGGIKVEEMASSVGLGFNLSAGGQITRVVVGIPDERQNGGFLYSSIKPSNFQPYTLTQLGLHADGHLDLDPDIFMYSFNGESGRFHFDESGNVKLMNKSGLKITCNYTVDEIHSFTIVDELGNTYQFAVAEASIMEYQSVGGGPIPNIDGYNTTWYLSEIKDMNNENKITLTYTANSYQYTTLSGGWDKLQTYAVASCSPFYFNETQVTTEVQGYKLTKIQGNSGYLTFNTVSDRSDLLGGVRLENISLYDSLGNFKKKVKFNHSYFSSGGASLYERRLKLNNFAEFGSSGTDSICYKFDYETANLPHRLSANMDYWGYANGAYNWTLLPNVVFTASLYGTTSTVVRSNLGNRVVSPSAAMASSLKKITYPTGGSREFVYEGNTALIDGSNQIILTGDNYINRQRYTNTFNYFSDSYPCYEDTFSVNSADDWVTFVFNLSVNINTWGHFRVEIHRVINPVTEILVTTFTDQYSGNYVLQNGNYSMKVFQDNFCDFNYFQAMWSELQDPGNITRYGTTVKKIGRNVGGIRIKEIKDYDPVTNKTASTKYFYKAYSQDSTVTSGLLITPVRFIRLAECSFNSDCQYFEMRPQTCYPLSSHEGSYVVYPEVRTVESGNGWIDQQYSFVYDQVSMLTDVPQMPPHDNRAGRGKLLSEKVYDQAGTLLKKSTFGYTSGLYSGQMGYKVQPYYHDIGTGNADRVPNGLLPIQACYDTYSLSDRFDAPFSTIDSSFTTTGNQVTLRTESQYYTAMGYTMLMKKKAYLETGDIRETTYRYAFNAPADFLFKRNAAEVTMASTLLSKNYLQPLEVVDSLKPASGAGIFLGGVKFLFANYNGTKPHISTVRQFTTLTDSAELHFYNYDVKGNVTERGKTNDIREVYLWGYGNHYPVVKVIGATYAQVMSLVSNAILQNPSSDAAMRTELEKIRTAFAGSQTQVFTYTYNPGVGMTSETDAAGRITYYEYDTFGRLARVRDHDRRIIKAIDYKMANP